MIQTVEAVIDERGAVRLLQPVHGSTVRRALVTILEEKPTLDITEATLLRDSAPVEAWNTPREDVRLLLRETAAWEAASGEDALKIEKMLTETK